MQVSLSSARPTALPQSNFLSVLDTLDTDARAGTDAPEQTHTTTNWPAEARRQRVTPENGAICVTMMNNYLKTGHVTNDGHVIQSALAHVAVEAFRRRRFSQNAIQL